MRWQDLFALVAAVQNPPKKKTGEPVVYATNYVEGHPRDRFQDIQPAPNSFWANLYNHKPPNMFSRMKDLPQAWTDLYESWNMAFVARKFPKQAQFILAKLFIPATLGAHSENYMAARIASLWLTANFGNILSAKEKNKQLKLPFTSTDPLNMDGLLSILGKQNRKFAEDQLLTHHTLVQGQPMTKVQLQENFAANNLAPTGAGLGILGWMKLGLIIKATLDGHKITTEPWTNYYKTAMWNHPIKTAGAVLGGIIGGGILLGLGAITYAATLAVGIIAAPFVAIGAAVQGIWNFFKGKKESKPAAPVSPSPTSEIDMKPPEAKELEATPERARVDGLSLTNGGGHKEMYASMGMDKERLGELSASLLGSDQDSVVATSPEKPSSSYKSEAETEYKQPQTPDEQEIAVQRARRNS